MQEQARVTPDYDLGHYLRPVRRHRALLITMVVLGFVVGLAYSVLSGRSYTSAEAINVNPPPALPGQPTAVNPQGARTTGLVNADTEAQVVKSTAVLAAAQKALHTTTSVGALRARLDVTVPPNSTILRISCKARSASAAQQCASAVTTAYLNNRTSTETAAIARQTASANAQLKSAQSQLNRLAAKIPSTTPGSAQRNYLFSLEATTTNNINSLHSDINQLKEADTTPGTVISAASSGMTSKLSRGIPPLTGLLVGLILGLLLIAWRERRDRYVRHSDDLKRDGVGMIAEIQPTKGRDSARRRRDGRSARTRFEQRVASVVAGSFDENGGVVYVADVSPDQEPDDVAERLCATLASVGHSVEIVRPADVELLPSQPAVAVAAPAYAEATDSQPPVQEPAHPEPARPEPPAQGSNGELPSLLGWPGQPVPSVPVTPPDVVPAEPVDPVDPVAAVIEAPPTVVEPTDSVPMTIRMRLEAARRRSQFVIIDGEPAVTDAQAYILAGLSDGALLVVDPDSTRRDDLAEVVDQISITGSDLIGAVIWRAERKKRRAAAAEAEQPRSRRQRRQETAAADEIDGVPDPDPRDESRSWPQRPVDAAH